jgi:hypothetical protein
MFTLVLTYFLAAANPLFSDPAADRLIREAVESSYNLQLEKSRSAAKELQNRFPEHPAGYTIMAETYWWEAQMDPHNSAIENTYYQAQDLAVRKSEAALKTVKYPKFEVLAYLASAHGSYARFQVTQKEAYLSALRAGLRAHRYAEEVYRLDKTYYDIYVGLAAFNYFTGTLPAVIKPFAFLIGARGNKDLGLEQFRIAMEKARYSRTEARIVYYTAMLEDKQYSTAFPVLEGLMTAYPDNFVLYVWATEWFLQQKKNLEGVDYFERLYQKQIKRSPVMAKYALLEKANLQIENGRKLEAKQTVQRIQNIAGADRLLDGKLDRLSRQLR